MNVTKEQLLSALEQKKKRIKQFNKRSKFIFYTLFLIGGISVLLIFVGIILITVTDGPFISAFFIYGGMMLIIAGVVLYIINRRITRSFCTKENHHPPSRYILDLTDTLSQESFSDGFMSQAEELLDIETDTLNQGHIRGLLVGGYLFRGEYDKASEYNIFDEKLFHKDSYYQLRYLNALMQCDMSVQPPRDIEDNYRLFSELFESDGINRDDPAVLCSALCCETNHASAHEDLQKALDALEMITLCYGDPEEPEQIISYGVKSEYASLMISKADILYHLGKKSEAHSLAQKWAGSLSDFPYQFNKARQLLQKFTQGHTEVQ